MLSLVSRRPLNQLLKGGLESVGVSSHALPTGTLISPTHAHHGQGFPKVVGSKPYYCLTFYCQRKCRLELELESEQLQVLAEWFPRNSSLGNHVRPVPAAVSLYRASY